MKFKAIMVDSPWPFKVYSEETGLDRSAEQHYDVMTLRDIEEVPVDAIADENCVLFHWVTWPLMPQAIQIGERWGFSYRTCAFNWVKLNKNQTEKPFTGLGYWTRCLRPTTEVYVQHKNVVGRITLQQLADSDWQNTSIWSPTGWKKINDVVRNEATVTQRVSTRLGDIVASADHRWFYKHVSVPRIDPRANARRRVHTIAIATTEELRQKRQLAVYRNKSNGLNLLFSTKPIEGDDPVTRVAEFDLSDDVAWMIGIFAAEGNYDQANGAGIRFSLHKRETDIAARIERTIKAFGFPGDRYFNSPMTVNHYEMKDKQSRVVHVSSKHIKALIETFIIGTGALGKRLNVSLLLQTSAQFRESLLLGIAEGDGTRGAYGWKGWQRIGLGNEGLIDDLVELTRSLGVMATKEPTRFHGPNDKGAGDPYYVLRFVHPRVQHLCFENTPVLPVRLDAIEPTGIVEPTYDLSVEGEAFVANDIITHNSNSEVCLLFTKGQPARNNKDVEQMIVDWEGGLFNWDDFDTETLATPIGRHSAKPDAAYQRIERLVDGPYCSIFERKRRKGWTTIGYELSGLDVTDEIHRIAALGSLTGEVSR